MKKIININLSGRVIPIEDSAYESLQRYIESLRRYFANEEGRDEIINDIESRIAELMNDKVRKGAAAVTDADIEEIIASMGRVEDLAEAEAADEKTTGTTSAAYTYEGKKRFKGRMYRDASDKIIAGVCSGIANYVNVDPAIIRLLFAIVTLGGFGFGFFIYILAWIILPVKNLEGYVGKRLFRNPEDKVIGGVAGGLGAYFNKDAWMIRLIFAAPLILNIIFSISGNIFNNFNGPEFEDVFMGSFTGTFLLAYIILWAVLPEARSPFEKMEMRGETVDVNRIRQNVQDRAQSWGEEVKTSAQQFGARAKEFAGTRGKEFAAEFSETARPVARGIGHVIGVLIKAFFLIVAGSIAFGLFVMVLIFSISGVGQPIKDFLINDYWQRISLWGVLVFFLAIPLIAFITWMIRRLIKVRSQNRYLGWIFGGLWLLGFISLGIFISTMVRDFRYTNKVEQRLTVAQPAGNRMIVRIDEPEIRYSGTFNWIQDDEERGWDLTEDSLYLASVKLRMAKSNDSFYHVTIWKYSAGHNRRDAAQRAEQINYTASSLDSALILGSGFGISKEQKFRAQRVLIEVRVPVGKKIMFDETMSYKLHDDVTIRMAENRNWSREEWDLDWDDDNYFNYRTNIDYVMTADGELVEANRPSSNSGNGNIYEYKKEDNKDSLRRAIEERERQLEEDRRKLEEMEGNTFEKADTEENESTAQASFTFSPLII